MSAPGGLAGLLSRVQRTPLWPASWKPGVDKSRGSKSSEVQRVWEIYDDWLQFMARLDALSLDESLDAGDVSRAWLVWSSAAETALADAYRFAGGLVGGPEARKARRNAADAHEGDVFMYRDSSAAPLLDLGRRFKAVKDVLDAMIRHGSVG